MTTPRTNIINSGPNFDLAEAALCVFEEVLTSNTAHSKAQFGIPANQDSPLYAFFKQGEGIAQVRTNCIEIAHWVDWAYNLVVDKYEYAECFDWDFVPGFLSYVLDTLHSLDEIDDDFVLKFVADFPNIYDSKKGWS